MTENTITPGAGPEEIEAARVLLARLGVCPDDLANTPSTRPPAPTFTEYIPQVSDAVSTGTRRVYSTYWKRVATEWGDRRLNEPTPLEIKQLAEKIRSQVVLRRNARGGRGAAEHLIAALRCLYNHAVDDGVISEADNPAKKVPKPRRLPSTRRGLPDSRLEEINHVAATTGNDPVLDTLILRLHTETACRRGGALALTPRDLDPDQCLILLHEKGGTVRWQPVSPTLMTHLRDHTEQRGAAASGGQLLRYTNGDPITTRRYDHLFTRLGKHLPWVATQQISIHWLRHTTLTWVERNSGYAVARAFAGHTNNNGDSATTTTYTRAGIHEIASALATLTGETHPLTT
ncbi:site-specific integrase [Saccharopolyspora spinosa]|uniref:Site-specific recombinase XerD n=1 Tax=Saccharopolyspora spinosa TaxID=60894 RepID=A0A2N3Y1P0_SACSN|nr:site-specific integrase [Saccharopolyspora spinosa]PKW16822.1 site-specific recombinase XerD [Saccharopolyspora spinosa]